MEKPSHVLHSLVLFTHRKRFAVLLLLIFFSATRGWAASVTFTEARLVADTFASPAMISNNGSKPNLRILGTGQENGYLLFSLSEAGGTFSGVNVQGATLRLFVNSVTSPGTMYICLLQPTPTWTENSVTGLPGNTPACDISVSPIAVPISASQLDQFVDVNVTPFVQDWLSGAKTNNGIGVMSFNPANLSQSDAINVQLDAKENANTSHPAALQMSLLATSSVPGLVTVPTCGANQFFNSVSPSGALECAPGSAGGTVTDVSTGPGILGGPITTTGTLSLDTAFTDSRYLKPNGDGSALTNVNAATLNGLASSTFAQLGTSNTFTANQVFKGGAKFGDPMIVNSTGDITTTGNIGSCGSSLTLSAAICSGTATTIDTSTSGFGSGGNVILLAGVRAEPVGPVVPEGYFFSTHVTNNGTSNATPQLDLSIIGSGSSPVPIFSWKPDGTVASALSLTPAITVNATNPFSPSNKLSFHSSRSMPTGVTSPSFAIGTNQSSSNSTDTFDWYYTPTGQTTAGSQPILSLDSNGMLTVNFLCFAGSSSNCMSQPAFGGTGTVTSVATDQTLTGGTITTSGTLGLNTAFTDARYALTGSTATQTFLAPVSAAALETSGAVTGGAGNFNLLGVTGNGSFGVSVTTPQVLGGSNGVFLCGDANSCGSSTTSGAVHVTPAGAGGAVNIFGNLSESGALNVTSSTTGSPALKVNQQSTSDLLAEFDGNGHPDLTLRDLSGEVVADLSGVGGAGFVASCSGGGLSSTNPDCGQGPGGGFFSGGTTSNPVPYFAFGGANGANGSHGVNIRIAAGNGGLSTATGGNGGDFELESGAGGTGGTGGLPGNVFINAASGGSVFVGPRPVTPPRLQSLVVDMPTIFNTAVTVSNLPQGCLQLGTNGVVSSTLFPCGTGNGTINGVTAGLGLIGGGNTGDVSLGVDATKVALLTTSGGLSLTGNVAANTLNTTGNANFGGGLNTGGNITVGTGSSPITLNATTGGIIAGNLNINNLTASGLISAASIATPGTVNVGSSLSVPAITDGGTGQLTLTAGNNISVNSNLNVNGTGSSGGSIGIASGGVTVGTLSVVSGTSPAVTLNSGTASLPADLDLTGSNSINLTASAAGGSIHVNSPSLISSGSVILSAAGSPSTANPIVASNNLTLEGALSSGTVTLHPAYTLATANRGNTTAPMTASFYFSSDQGNVAPTPVGVDLNPFGVVKAVGLTLTSLAGSSPGSSCVAAGTDGTLGLTTCGGTGNVTGTNLTANKLVFATSGTGITTGDLSGDIFTSGGTTTTLAPSIGGPHTFTNTITATLPIVASVTGTASNVTSVISLVNGGTGMSATAAPSGTYLRGNGSTALALSSIQASDLPAGAPGTFKDVMVFNTPGSGVFVPSAGVTHVTVECVGGGGGGGGGFLGAGGGAGGYGRSFIAVGSSPITFIVGASGNGGPATGGSGSAGGVTIFDGLSCSGGAGGGSSNFTTGSAVAAGGGGGGVGGANVNAVGQPGQAGIAIASSPTSCAAAGGGGGGGPLGGGGGGAAVSTGAGAGGAGGFGGGGGGGGACNSSIGGAGGAGGIGEIVLTEYY